MKYLDKETMAMGAGAGVGVIQTIIMKEYVDVTYGPIPGIGTSLGEWGKWSTLGNILIGGVVFGISTFTGVIANKSYEFNKFLQMYGITALIGGIVNGIFPRTTAVPTVPLRNASMPRLAPRGLNRRVTRPVGRSAAPVNAGRILA